jgi:hypothetical protein
VYLLVMKTQAHTASASTTRKVASIELLLR